MDETRKLKTIKTIEAGPTKADLEALKKMNAIRDGWAEKEKVPRGDGCLTKLLFLAALVGIVWFIAANRPTPSTVAITRPTEILISSTPLPIASTLQPTPTLAPSATASYTPLATSTGTVTASPTATSTAVPTYTPQPSYTPLATYTAESTHTPLPSPTPTEPPFVSLFEPTAVSVTNAVNELEDTRQSLLLAGGMASSLVILSLGFLAYNLAGLRRRPAPPITVTAVVPNTAVTSPTLQQLPPPDWEPKRENHPPEPVRDTGLTGLTSSEPVRDTGSQTITMNIEPVQGEADDRLIRELWEIWIALAANKERQSLNAVCFKKWGGKNPQRLALVRRAIAWGGGQQRPIITQQTRGGVRA